MAVDTPRNMSVQEHQQVTDAKATKVRTNAIWLWAFLISALAFWSSSLVIYTDGAGAEFARISPSAFLVSALSVTAGIGATFLVTWATGRILGTDRVFATAAFWLAAYLSLTAMIFRLPQGVGMTSLSDYGTSWVNLAAAVALATVASLLLRTKAAVVPLVALLAISVSSVAAPAYDLLTNRTATSGASPVLSGNNDIIVLSFDGIQHDVFERTIQQHPELIDRLRNFRYFDNVIASSPATHASLTGVLAGNRNFKAEAQTTDDLIALARAQGIPTKLAEAGYLVSGYGPFSQVMLPEFDMTASLVRGDPTSELAYLLQVSASRHVGPQVATSDLFARGTVAIARRVPIDRPSYEHSISEQIDRGHGPDWDRSLLRSWDDFVTYRENLQVRGDTRAVHFLHFTFTHHPVDFDPECAFRSEDQAWYDANQSYAGLLVEAACAVRSMEAILARLHEIGAFDDNLVVVMSDHGAPVQWNDPSTLEGKKIRDNADWGYGRYLPVLMVKLPGERRDGMEHDGRPVILDDLALSLCRWAQLQDCSEYAGTDLLDSNAVPAEGYFINVVASASSTFRFETHETVYIDRSTDPLAELDRYLSDAAR